MAPEKNKEKSIEELMAEVSRELEGAIGAGQDMGVSRTASRGDIPPWEDDLPAADLFPALNNNSEGEIETGRPPLPQPTPDRDRDGYDRDNWSRLLRMAKDMRLEIAEYLEVLRQAGIGLELKKYKKKNLEGKFIPIEKFKLTPGENKNWDDRRIKEVMSALYTYMMYLPARKELATGHQVLTAMETAIKVGGVLAVSEGGLKFDWSRVTSHEKIDYARGMMDQCGAEIMQYIKLAERRLRDIGFVVSLAEMSDCVEGFNN